jgi:D-amino peptidase
MNIYVMCDAEGISGIYDKEQVLGTGPLYKECRECMTRDINTVIDALKEAGVDRIYVRDAHGSGANIIWDKLSAKAYRYIIGNTGTDRFPYIDDCDGVILFGYHAMAGTKGALLDHSMSSKRIQNYWINGKAAGETAIDAGIVGDKGIPVIMVMGDDSVCKEAEAILPWAVTCEVKTSASTYGAQMQGADESQFIIKEKTREAIKRHHEMKPLIYNKPITLRVEVTERNAIPDTYARPYMRILDGRTFEVTGETMEEALCRQY